MTDDIPTPERRGLIPPQQKRSEATLARIMAGALSLLATRELATISMEEIAATAGVSVGSIYRRFKSREDLLAEMLRDLQVQQLAALDEELAAERWRGVRLEARLDWIVERQQEAAARAPGFIRAIFARLMAAPEAANEETARLNAMASERLARWLLECGPEIAAPDPETIARVAVTQLSVSLHLAQLYPATFAPSPAETVAPILKRIALAALRGERPGGRLSPEPDPAS